MHIYYHLITNFPFIFRYIGVKFDQINEHLKNISNNNKHGVAQAWNNAALRTLQRQFAKTPNNKWMIWIIMLDYSCNCCQSNCCQICTANFIIIFT